MQITKLKLSELAPNTGQIPGLPINPRQWTKGDVERLAKSLSDTPELFEARPIIAVPFEGKFVILGGNMRFEASRTLGWNKVPVLVLNDLPVEKMKEIVLADNGDFGEWDYIALSQDWADLPLADLGIYTTDPADYSEKNKEIDPSQFSEDITLKLKFEKPVAEWVKNHLGENPKDTILKLVHYAE